MPIHSRIDELLCNVPTSKREDALSTFPQAIHWKESTLDHSPSVPVDASSVLIGANMFYTMYLSSKSMPSTASFWVPLHGGHLLGFTNLAMLLTIH